MFQKILYAGWADMDFNSHMGNVAFLSKAADVRMMYFAENGFSVAEMMKLRVGPVVMKDEIEYFREVHLLQELKVGFSSVGLSIDGSRFIIRNEITHSDGKRCATVTSTGGWMDLNARKLIAPPEALRRAMEALPRVEGFAELPSSLKS